MHCKGSYAKTLLFALFGLGVQAAYSHSPSSLSTQASQHYLSGPSYLLSMLKEKNPHLSIQLGGFQAHQGRAQSIQINGLIGDYFSVSHSSDYNGLFGLAYSLDGLDRDKVLLSYGINALYLPRASVSGTVLQEDLFTNLGYQYSVVNYPIYAAVKATIKNASDLRYNVNFDLGIGANIIRTSNVHETSLDGGITQPDFIFKAHTSAAFTAMAGVNLKVNNVFGQMPVECGYRFFYLGQADFAKANDQVLNTLNTGNAYANAIICAVTI
jgi:hypothetical protein